MIDDFAYLTLKMHAPVAPSLNSQFFYLNSEPLKRLICFVDRKRERENSNCFIVFFPLLS